MHHQTFDKCQHMGDIVGGPVLKQECGYGRGARVVCGCHEIFEEMEERERGKEERKAPERVGRGVRDCKRGIGCGEEEEVDCAEEGERECGAEDKCPC